jgi:tRNA(Ile)-lysidine synthetase-like protein
MSQYVDDDRPGESAFSPRERGLVQRVRQRFRQTGLPAGSLLLVGFSGGADSLALLAALAALGRAGLVSVHAIHVDHGLRPSSGIEATTARDVAGRLGVECDVIAVDADRLSHHVGVGIEETARRERWRAFAEVATARGAVAVVLGHHQLDQAETVLLHLARGAGLAGATGMSSLTTMRVPWWLEAGSCSDRARMIQVWRPLLDEPVVEVRAFAESLGLPIVEDPSNDDLALRRNAIRHEVLPALERAMPGATAGLARYAALAAEDEAELDRQASTLLQECSVEGVVRRATLLALPVALQRRVVRRWLATECPSVEVSADRVEAVLRVAEQPGGRRTVEVGQGVTVVVERDELRVIRASPE